jgi:hypothetical protein
MSKISELSDGGALLSTDDLIVVRSGGNVRAQLSSLNGIAIGSSTPAAGSFTTGSFSGNVSFADNAKAIFGGGSDLQIYHDGLASYIKENGTGDLIIQGSNTMRFQGSSNQELANFTTGGAVTLFNNGSAKLATTSTGIDVTGSVTATSANISDDNNYSFGDGTTYIQGSGSADRLKFITAGQEAIRIDSSQNVGIGPSSITSGFKLEVTGDARFGDAVGDDAVELGWSSGGSQGFIQAYDRGASAFRDLSINNAVTVTSGGNVGIGVTPDGALSLESPSYTSGGVGNGIRFQNGNNTADAIIQSYYSGTSSSSLLHGVNSYLSTGAAFTAIDSNKPSSYFLQNTNGSFDFGSAQTGNPTSKVTIDTSGRLGIGTSSPAAPLSFGSNIPSDGQTIHTYQSGNTRSGLGIVAGVHRLFTDTSSSLSFGQVSTTDGSTYTERMRITSGGALQLADVNSPNDLNCSIFSNSDVLELEAFGTNGAIAFSTGSSVQEAMRIDSSGNLLCSDTSASFPTNVQAVKIFTANIGISHNTSNNSGDSYVRFGYSTNTIGSITQNGTTAVLYNTSSDQRLKENIQDAADAGELIDAIQVRQFDWKVDGEHQRFGMVAQELTTVAPEAVSTPEDPDEMMGVDYSKLVPMLIKEIQTLRSRVSELEK